MDCGRLYENRESVALEKGLMIAIDVPSSSKSIYWSFKSHPTQRLRGENPTADWDASWEPSAVRKPPGRETGVGAEVVTIDTPLPPSFSTTSR